MLAGLTASVGTVGDAYDNALAETTIGLYKTECTRAGSPFRNGPIHTLADLEEATSAWVAWYNTGRLMHRLGRRPPARSRGRVLLPAGEGRCMTRRRLRRRCPPGAAQATGPLLRPQGCWRIALRVPAATRKSRCGPVRSRCAVIGIPGARS